MYKIEKMAESFSYGRDKNEVSLNGKRRAQTIFEFLDDKIKSYLVKEEIDPNAFREGGMESLTIRTGYDSVKEYHRHLEYIEYELKINPESEKYANSQRYLKLIIFGV